EGHSTVRLRTVEIAFGACADQSRQRRYDGDGLRPGRTNQGRRHKRGTLVPVTNREPQTRTIKLTTTDRVETFVQKNLRFSEMSAFNTLGTKYQIENCVCSACRLYR